MICVLAVLGFILSWITGVVAKEEVEIKTSMMILFLTGVIWVVVGFATIDLDPSIRLPCLLATPLISLMLLIRYAGHVPGKQAIIISVVFTIILNVFLFGIGWMLG